MPSVVLDQVSRHFGQAAAVDKLDLKVEDQEFMTLLGASGCGKTTTLRMVAGLEHNDAGSIAIGDTVVSDPGRGIFVPPDRRQLGMVFQSYAIWPHMTVFENVAYPLRVRRLRADEVRSRVLAALRMVEMESLAERGAPQLSGGQQQRVAIARALVFEPKVLLLDEPLSNLDSKLRATMGQEFRALQRRLGITTIYVTHDQEEAMTLSDRVVVMQGGRILQTGTPDAIYQRPGSRYVASFFGSPNLFEASVTGCEPLAADRYRLSVQGTGWRGQCLADTAGTPGEAVIVMARAENVALAGSGGTPADDRRIEWSGKVVSNVYRGARRSLVVDCAGLRVHAEAPYMDTVSIGDNVTLTTQCDSAWAIHP